MKTLTFPTFLLAIALTLPGSSQRTFAQNNSDSSSSAQSSSQSAPASNPDLEPIQAPKSTNFWDGDDPNLVNLVTHPFANKKYVQRLTRPIKDRLNELDELTTNNTGAIKDVDSRAQHGLQLASEKTSLADEHATDAGNKAQAAQLAANSASTSVSTAEQQVASLDQYKASALTEIRFAPGQNLLSKNAKDALDNMAAPLKDQHSYVIEVRGFSSGHGQAAIEASQKMADSVVRYLVLNHSIPVYRIYVLSMGDAPLPADAGTTKRFSGGRVEVNVLKNDLVTSAQR
jgi:outer membrane protein OmpA-like peptidoglycan-associated protein